MRTAHRTLLKWSAARGSTSRSAAPMGRLTATPAWRMRSVRSSITRDLAGSGGTYVHKSNPPFACDCQETNQAPPAFANEPCTPVSDRQTALRVQITYNSDMEARRLAMMHEYYQPPADQTDVHPQQGVFGDHIHVTEQCVFALSAIQQPSTFLTFMMP